MWLSIGNAGRHSVDDWHTFIVPDCSFSHFCSLLFWNFLTVQLYHISLFQWNSDFFQLLFRILNNISVKFLFFCIILSKEGYLWMIIEYEWQKR
nr:MAG TPA: hypothetical protein [Caudoviricetes sp.]